MQKSLILPVLLCMAAACVHGPRLDKLRFPTRPEGAQTTIRTTTGPVAGELLSTADTGFVILTASLNRVLLVPMRITTQVRAEGLDAMRPPLGGTQLRQLRLVSRHPYGITPEIRAALLEKHGQTEIEIRP